MDGLERPGGGEREKERKRDEGEVVVAERCVEGAGVRSGPSASNRLGCTFLQITSPGITRLLHTSRKRLGHPTTPTSDDSSSH